MLICQKQRSQKDIEQITVFQSLVYVLIETIRDVDNDVVPGETIVIGLIDVGQQVSPEQVKTEV